MPPLQQRRSDGQRRPTGRRDLHDHDLRREGRGRTTSPSTGPMPMLLGTWKVREMSATSVDRARRRNGDVGAFDVRPRRGCVVVTVWTDCSVDDGILDAAAARAGDSSVTDQVPAGRCRLRCSALTRQWWCRSLPVSAQRAGLSRRHPNRSRHHRTGCDDQMTTTVVPTSANAHRNWASGLAWRWQPLESRVPSSSSVW